MSYGIGKIALYLPPVAVARGDIAAANAFGKTASGHRRIANFDEDRQTLAWEMAHALARHAGPVAWADFGGDLGFGREAAVLGLAAGLTDGVFKLTGGVRGGWDFVAASCRQGRPQAMKLVTTALATASLSDPAASAWCDAAAGLAWNDDAGLEVVASYQIEAAYGDLRADSRTGHVESDISAFVAQKYVLSIRNALENLGVGEDIHLAVSLPAAGAVKRIAKLKCKSLTTTDFKKRGFAGVADPAFVLSDALSAMKLGDHVVLCILGDGLTAFRLHYTNAERLKIEGPRWQEPLETVGLQQWRRFRRLDGAAQYGPAGSQVLTDLDTAWEYGLVASRCGACSAITFPAQGRCHVCGSDRVNPETISMQGDVFTFTIDHLHDSLSSPTTMIVADMQGGGRVYLQGTDDLAHDVSIGRPVEMVFRRIHDGEDGRSPHYFWKLRSRQ